MIDTRYKFINLDLLLETNNKRIIFSLSDVETSDFFIKLTRDGKEINLTDYKITLWVCKPNKVTKSKILEYDAITKTIYCNLEEELKNIEGVYIAQLVVEDLNTNEKKFTRSRFEYIVQSDILSEIDESIIEENENILSDILNRLTNIENNGIGGGASIDDTTTAKNKTWSSSKIDSQFENIKQQIEQGGIGGSVDLTDYAKTKDVPTKTSQLNNDSGFLTSIPSEYITETKLIEKGYITDISGKVDKVIGKGLSTNDYTTNEKNKLSNIEENANNYSHPATHNANMITQDNTHRFVTDIEKNAWNNKSTFSGSYTDLIDKPTIPTKTSQLNNDSNYLTSHQDISGKIDKSAITLGIHTDGLVYLFVDGEVVGNGVELGQNGDVIGMVDSNKNIILNGNLGEGIYTLKYEMEDGSLVNIGELNISDIPAYTNQIPISLDENGNIYNGQGYKIDCRISASTFTEKANEGYSLTGYIPYKKGDIIRIKGFTFNSSTDEANANYIVYYDSSHTKVAFTTLGYMFATDEGNGIYCNSNNLNNIDKASYFRVSVKQYINQDTIITVNQNISE